jgi:hypothetical protein
MMTDGQVAAQPGRAHRITLELQAFPASCGCVFHEKILIEIRGTSP